MSLLGACLHLTGLQQSAAYELLLVPLSNWSSTIDRHMSWGSYLGLMGFVSCLFPTSL